MKIREIDTKTKEVKLDSYEYDRINSVQVADLKLDDDSMLLSWPIETLIRSVDNTDHPNYHLANYFTCSWLLERYGKQALVKNSVTRYTPAPWRLLRLADKYKWIDVRDACLQVCKKHKGCSDQDGWKELTSTISAQTFQELVKALLHC